MKEEPKLTLGGKIGKTIAFSVLALVLGTIGMPFFLIFTTLSGNWEPWWVYAIGGVLVGWVVLGIIAASEWFEARGRRVLGWCAVGVLAAGLLYGAVGEWRASIPTVDDRGLMLSEYEPFMEGTKAVWLEEEPTLKFSSEERLPTLDGATALYPVYAGFVQAVYPEGEYPMYESHGVGRVACTNTVGAYDRLIAGEVDMIFVAGPSQAQLEEAKNHGRELHLHPIGREAFVFFVNTQNPVTGLTVEQVQQIYSGEITNWSEVGGPNWNIRAFQRAENSGSQTALQRLMEGLPLIEPEKEDRIGDMGGIISAVASYRNYKNALGFSFRYYSTQMVGQQEIRLLALDGVEPTPQTIADGSYPISSEFYAVTASAIGGEDPAETMPALQKLLEWILSPQGQQVVERTGYVPVG
ncbi:MAG: substrate-binding domain-containing protein [Eubacteriales bacterium]